MKECTREKQTRGGVLIAYTPYKACMSYLENYYMNQHAALHTGKVKIPRNICAGFRKANPGEPTMKGQVKFEFWKYYGA